ncbi:hypothetical protein [Agromyces salentinus]|uniref:hypothetical protein n=1 Tax=Agromyces salentinus TaxID=269421 RepID=UPI0012F92162
MDYGPDDSAPTEDRPCPLCGHRMGDHAIDHSTPESILVCPTTDRLPERPIDTPLNEFGMPVEPVEDGRTRGM